MFTHYRTAGLIIKKTDIGEADQLFSIYTQDFGKLEILGRAIRKIASKLRSGAELFYFSDIEFIQGKAYKTLTDAILIEKFSNIRKDLEKLIIIYQIAEIFDKLVKEPEKDETLWQLLNETLDRLNHYPLSTIHYPLLYYYFLWNFLSLLGYKPELNFCQICQQKITKGKVFFSKKEGGVICPQCFKKVEDKIATELETIFLVRLILEKKWQILESMEMNSNLLKITKQLSEYYLSEV